MGIKQSGRMAARNLYKVWTLHGLYPSRYRKCAKKPVEKNKIVFLEIRMPELTDSFRLLYQKLDERKQYQLKVCCIREGMIGRAQVRKNCLAAIEELATAQYIFINDSSYLISSLPLRPETKVIQTWHACGAFKKFGYSIADKKFGSGKSDLERFPVHRNFSYVTVSSPEVVWAYAEAFHMEREREKILPLGISRTDLFYQPKRRQAAYEKLWKLMPECRGKRVVLYAPTFRGRVADAVSPDVLDFEKMGQALGDGWVFLCKHHPFVKKRPEIPASCRDYARDVTQEMEIEELLMVSDVCISDYSSLIFEYSLFGRPMIFLAYDLEDYYDWRGFYYPYEEMTPGPVVRTTEEVIDYLAHLEERFDKKKVADFREKFMSACDGHATERILSLIT
ncbi:MAG: CDP-glycerol glycerophosphotransferase family protein [Lachnospiraceae bacterium]|nr:CDP-glycerol glycerophosphotransferase family protein [Lachnospiraceae bacterium]